MCIRKIFASLAVVLTASLLCFVLLIAGMPCVAGGAEPGGLRGRTWTGPSSEPWHIQANQLTYDQKTKVYEAQGNVKITSAGRTIQADWARMDTTEHRAELVGNVELRYGKDWMKGDYVVWNIDTQTGWADGGIIYFGENNFYVRGKRIVKTGPETYDLTSGSLTSCDPADPAWIVRYGHMKVDTDGLTWASNTSFWAGKVPLLYFPLTALPITQKRQSGFLMPYAGSSSVNGMEVELPFYWAIRKDMDATFYGRYMEERGWMSGVEYRITNNTWGDGIWLVNYLHDMVSEEHAADQGYPLVQRDRFWIRSRHSFEMPYGIKGWLNLDVVSDRNYLQEFRTGSAGWNYSNQIFTQFTGRGILDDKNILTRESNLYLNHMGENALLAMDVRYFDNLDRSQDEFTLQQVPEFIFDVAQSPLFPGSGLYYSLDSSLVNYWRQEGDRGDRLDVFPHVYYPFHLKQYLDVEPSVGVRTTGYWVDWQDRNESSWQSRAVPEMEVDFSSRLSRVYPLNWRGIAAVQNVIRPEVVYEYIPKVNEGELPVFDAVDRYSGHHGIRYGISSFLTGKTVQGTGDNATASYRELARIRLYQTYNIIPEPAIVQQSTFFVVPTLSTPTTTTTTSGETATTPNRQFSNMVLDLDLTPYRFLTLSSQASVSPYTSSESSYDFTVGLDSTRGHTLGITYHALEDASVNEIIEQAKLKITSNIFLQTFHDYSFERSEFIEQAYGLTFQRGCWAITFGYRQQGDNDWATVSFSLSGLGMGFGGGFSPVSGGTFFRRNYTPVP